MGISVFPAPSSAGKTVKGQVFTSNSNWTAPTGVNYVTVTAQGGGGGGGGSALRNSSNQNAGAGGSGGDTSFGTNLLIAKGGTGGQAGISGNGGADGSAAAANSGQGGLNSYINDLNYSNPSFPGKSSNIYIATVAVTPATTYAVTIGAGGNAGTKADGGNNGWAGGAGGSGWLALEWEE